MEITQDMRIRILELAAHGSSCTEMAVKDYKKMIDNFMYEPEKQPEINNLQTTNTDFSLEA